MAAGVKLYSWKNSWVGKDAMTDTPPGSPERKLLDILTDPKGKFKIDPAKIDQGYQVELGKWKENEAGNKVYRFAEALEFIDRFPGGRDKFRPALDEIGLVDPLDTRKLPEEIRTRIALIKSRVEQFLDLKDDDPQYCDKFVPEFYKQAMASYRDGGLCFVPSGGSKRFPKEGIAVDALTSCISNENMMGKCSEYVYSINASIKLADGQCDLHPVWVSVKGSKEDHMFLEYVGSDGKTIRLNPLASVYDPELYEHPKHLADWHLISVYYLNSVNYLPLDGQEALNAGLMAVLSYPEFASAHNNYGTVLKNHGDFGGALNEYERSLELDPNQPRSHLPEVYNNFASQLFLRNDFPGGISACQKSLAMKEDQPTVHNVLGSVYLIIGDAEAAIKELKRSIELDDNSSLAHFNLAEALVNAGEYYEAMKHYTKSIELDDKLPDAHFSLAKLYLRLRRTEDSIVELKQTVALQNDNKEAYYALMLAFIVVGDYKNAEISARRVVELMPESPEANRYFGEVLRENGKDREAEKYLRRAEELKQK